jgi:hypothetical protein
VKSSKWLFLTVAVVVLIGVVLYVARRPQTETKVAETPMAAVAGLEKTQPVVPSLQPEEEMTAAATPVAPAPEIARSQPVQAVEQPDSIPQGGESADSQMERQTIPSDPLESVELQPDVALAEVNGVTLTLKDLISVNRSESAAQTMRSDAYNHLLAKAIERQVIFQAAEAQGLELDEAQKHELETILDAAFERAGEPYVPAGYDAQAQGEFEIQVRTAELLLDLLLNEPGPPSQYVTPERVQEYYAEHQAEFDKLPEDPAARSQAWPPIEAEIRDRLTSEVFVQHERKRRQLLEVLKSEGTIEQFNIGTGD